MFFDIKESDIDVKYGMYNLRQERDMARHSLTYILNDFNDIKRSYFNLGFHLNEFIQCKYYEDFGYTSFKDFCIENIPLDYSSVTRVISVFDMICERSSNNMFLKTNRIQDKYKEYSYSQLVEMIPMSDDLRKEVTPNMSVRDIRDLKSNKSKKIVTSPGNCDVAIDDSALKFELVDMIKKKYKNVDITALTYCKNTVWFQAAGKQYKITFNVSEIKD